MKISYWEPSLRPQSLIYHRKSIQDSSLKASNELPDSLDTGSVFLVAPHVREYGATDEALHVDYLLTPPPSATARNSQQQQQLL